MTVVIFKEADNEIKIVNNFSLWYEPLWSNDSQATKYSQKNSTVFHVIDDTLFQEATRMTEQMHRAYDTANYDHFVKDWSDSCRQDFPKEEFKRQHSELFSILGNHQIIVPLITHKNPAGLVDEWHMYCAKRQ